MDEIPRVLFSPLTTAFINIDLLVFRFEILYDIYWLEASHFRVVGSIKTPQLLVSSSFLPLFLRSDSCCVVVTY
jgi:hypothetical protein